MRVRIHRGAHEIGGNCIELEAKGQHIVLDLGRPLDARHDETVTLPSISGLAGDADASLLGIVISHPHQDHYGLLPQVSPRVPVFIGEAAARIVNEATWFNGAERLSACGHIHHLKPITIGPFRITPHLNDHSAFDAYSLLIEAGGRRLFYTGDIRGSGRKARVFDALCARPPTGIHAMLMEGTHVRPADDAAEGMTEHQVEDELLDLCRRTTGAVFVAYSGQNIDRLVSAHRAALRAGRELVVDLYGATMGRATGNPRIPQPGHRGLRVLVPQRQRVRIRSEGCFHRVDELGPSRLYAEDLRERPSKFVVTLRGNVLPEFEKMADFDGAAAVWSMWDGYLEQANSRRVLEFLARHAIPLTSIHASGHATVRELQRLVEALSPERVVPIHSSATSRFAEFFPRVVNHRDGEWWTV